MSQGSQGTEVLSQESNGTAPLSQSSQENDFNASHVIPVTPHKTDIVFKNESRSSLKKHQRRLIPRSSSIILRPTRSYRSRKPFSNKLKHRKITKKRRFNNRLAGEYHNGVLHSLYSRGRKIKTLDLSRRSPKRRHFMRGHTHKKH
jgi:hypothetical protein